MEEKIKLKRKGVFVYLTVFVGVIGLVFLPEIGSFIWHFFNANPVNHYGWEITVPNGWFAYTQRRQLFVETLPRLYWLKEKPLVYFHAINDDPETLYDQESWKEQESPALRTRGYEITGTRNMSAGGGNAYCVESVSKDNELNVYHQCILFDYNLRISYKGPKKHLSQFYEITQKIRRVPLPNVP